MKSMTIGVNGTMIAPVSTYPDNTMTAMWDSFIFEPSMNWRMKNAGKQIRSERRKRTGTLTPAVKACRNPL